MSRIALLSVVLLSLPLAAFGQSVRSDVRGPSVVVHAQRLIHANLFGTNLPATIQSPGRETLWGYGGGLQLSYGFTQRTTLFAHLDATAVDGTLARYYLVHGDAGLRLTWHSWNSPTRPYFDLAATLRSAETQFDGQRMTARGLGFTTGLGIQRFLSQSLGLDFGIRLTVGPYSDLRVPVSATPVTFEATSIRYRFGMVWFY
ncbi:MAG: hypothetical protein RhofKO_00990 [Rhodothermales bacterium]